MAGGQSLESRLKQLFPAATAFSPRGAIRRTSRRIPGLRTRRPSLGYAFWTTEILPLERGYGGPIAMLVGLEPEGKITGVIMGEHHEPYGDFSIDPPKFAATVPQQGRARPVQAGRGRRRRLARDDHDVERGARDPEQRPAHGAPIPHGSHAPIEMIPGALGALTFLPPSRRASVMSSWAGRPGASPASAQPPGEGVRTFRRRGRGADLVRRHPRAGASTSRLVVAFIALAFISFFRKSVALKYVTLVACRDLLGFWKSTLISIVNVFGLFGGNLPLFRYNLAWYLLAAIAIVSTMLWGRVYCGRICAFGALTQLMDRMLPAKWRSTCRARSSAARR